MYMNKAKGLDSVENTIFVVGQCRVKLSKTIGTKQ